MVVDEPGAVSIPNNNFYTLRNGMKPRYIILHGTANGTSAEAIAHYFASTQGTANPVSSHYIIGTDGEIVQCVPEEHGAWANGIITQGHAPWWYPTINPNNTTISIEHCKPSVDNSDALTEAQEAASFNLVRHICQRWNIPMREADVTGGITGHYSIDPVNRERCPGLYPWNELWAALNKEEVTPMVQIGQGIGAFFTDMGNDRWHCKKTNCDLIGANLKFWRAHEGLGGLPLANEKDGVALCERWIQIYDPLHKIDHPDGAGDVYLMHITSGAGQQLASASLVSSLQAQIAALKEEQTDDAGHATNATLQTALQQILAIAEPFKAKL